MTNALKKGFILYYDYRQHLALLDDEDRGKLLMALIDYGETGSAPELEGAARMAFSFIQAQMDRDAAKYAETVRKRSEAGKQGGRPRKADESNGKHTEAKKANAFSEKQTEAKKGDTDTDTVTDTVTDTDTDNNDKSTAFSLPAGSEPPAAEQTPYKAIVALYHEICKSYPQLRNVSENRKKAIAARWKEYGHDLDTFRELFEKAEASPFLKGKNAKNWTADFNWLMNSENMAKVLEGKYDNDREKGGHTSGEHRANNERAENRGNTGTTALSGFRMAHD